MLCDKLKIVNDQVVKACQKRGISASGITFVAVTKTVPADQVREIIQLGVKDIGESKIQEAQSKFINIGDTSGVTKHLIGHLQTNKAKKAVEMFDMIQSVDSIHVAEAVNKQAESVGKIQKCLIEVNVSGETAKYGAKPEETLSFVDSIEKLKNISICGLMTMAPYSDDSELSRPYFKTAKKIFDDIVAVKKMLQFNILSMGMSGDFGVAIEEGATMVRVGTVLFKDE